MEHCLKFQIRSRRRSLQLPAWRRKVKSMDEIAVLMDRLETYEPTKTLQELAREMPLVPGLRLLASREQLPARHLLPRRHPSPNKRRLLLPTSRMRSPPL
jgi:hypothetical protein